MVFRRGGIARRVTALAVACFAAPLAAVAQAPLLVHAGATVSVVSSSRWGPDQSRIPQYHLVGEVANSGDTSSKPYNATDIRVRATDPLGNPVATVDTAAITLGPGQRSPFDIATASPCTGCTLSVTFAPTADPANRRFSITPDPLTVTTDPDGTQHFSGTVTNHNTIAAGDVHVTLTFYSGANGTGIVVDQDQIPLNNNATSTLNSGDSADFDISRSPEHPAYGSFAVFAESSSAPSLPVLTPSPLPFDIGNVHVGSSAPKVLTVTNSGNDDLHIGSLSLSGVNASDFSLASGQDGCTGTVLVPSDSCTVGVSLTPTAIGARNAALNVADDTANNPDAIPLQGTGQAPDISAGDLDLGDVVVGRTATNAVIVTNIGNADLHIDTANSGIPHSASAFSADLSACAAAVPPGQNCNIAISFAPEEAGSQSTTLTIAAVASDHAFDAPKQVTISGTGTNPTMGVSPATLDFGSQTIGAPTSGKTVTVSNSGIGNMHVTGAHVTNHPNDYSISGCTGSTATVPQGSSCALIVVFTAQAGGDRSDTLTVSADANNSPKTVALSGRGSGAGAILDKDHLAFGRVNVDKSSASQRVTLTNSGNQDLTITGIGATGDFTQTNNCGSLPATVHAAGSCHADVTFTPRAGGDQTGKLTFTDNAGSSTRQDVVLTGTGVVPSSGWQPLLGSLTSSPASSSWGPGRLDVFARGRDDALYHTWTDDGTNWHYWTRLGGSLTSNPAAVSWGPNRIDVFARGRDTALYQMSSTNGIDFSSWKWLGGTLSSDPAASSRVAGRLDVFARGQDLALYHKFTTNSGTTWTPWDRLGGTLSSSAAAVSWGGTRIDAFASGQDRALYHMSSTNGVTFTPWQRLGGSITSDPTASSWGPTRLDAFARGQDGSLMHISSDDGSTFSSWESLGGSLTSNPAAASPENGRIDLFARGRDLGLYHMILTLVG